MVDNLLLILPESYRKIFLLYQEPIVIVKYEREHFVSYDEKLRLTLDYGLTFFDQRPFQQAQLLHRIAQPDFVILECKTAPGSEAQLREVLYPLQLRITRSSKYVSGCSMIGALKNRGEL